MATPSPIASGSTEPNNDFGNFQPARSPGVKFNDLNANGTKDALEPGLSGWTIRAYVDTSGDGILQATETTIAASDTTVAGGAYSLSLNPGKYVVCEVKQATWTQSRPTGTLCSLLPAGENVAPGGYAVTITSGSTEPNNDFGNFQQGTKSGNEVSGPRTPTAAGTPMASTTSPATPMTRSGSPTGRSAPTSTPAAMASCRLAETTIAASATTNASGAYSLSLNPGKYVVCEVKQATWFQSQPANTKCSLLPAGQNVAPGGYAVTITSGSTEPGNDFGNFKKGTIIVEKQTDPDGAPGLFTFTGTAAGQIGDNGTITVNDLLPGSYTSSETDPTSMLFKLTSIVCNDGDSTGSINADGAGGTATFRLQSGETVRCVFTNTKQIHPGTMGFWRNWRNHYTDAQFQILINYLKTNNYKVYNKDQVLNTADDLTIAKVDAIYNFGSATPVNQKILAQLTALKLNLAISQLDGTNGLVQFHEDICLGGTLNVSGIPGATAFSGRRRRRSGRSLRSRRVSGPAT